VPALAPLVVAVLVGTAWTALSWFGDHGRELVNAGAWWWGWLGLPVAAAAIGAWSRQRTAARVDPWLIAAVLVAPMAVGFVAHDSVTDRHPTYWPEGWVLLVILAVLCTVSAAGLDRRREPG
jgi:hypothetical protein